MTETESQLPPELRFKLGSPFYPMLSTFMIATSGLEGIFRKDNPLGIKAGQDYVFEGKVHKEFRIEQHRVYNSAQKGKINSLDTINHLCSMLVNICYETVKVKNDKSPLFEFFRHIRNACSHQNSFYFLDHEPSRQATWRNLTIDHNLKGANNILFGKQCFGDYLSVGDAILLLWDIDQKYN